VPCPWTTEQPWASSVGFAGAQPRPELSTNESRRPLLPRVCRLHKPPSRRRLHLALHLRPCRFQVSKAPVPRRKKPFRHAAWKRAGSSLVCTPDAYVMLVARPWLYACTRPMMTTAKGAIRVQQQKQTTREKRPRRRYYERSWKPNRRSSCTACATEMQTAP